MRCRRIFFILILISFSNCLTLQLENITREKNLRIKPTNLESVSLSPNGWIRLQFSNLDSGIKYRECISPNDEFKRLTDCPPYEPFSTEVSNYIREHEINGKKGIWYLEESYVLLSPYLLNSVFISGNSQFGQATDARISSSGKEILLVYPKVRANLPEPCYHETIDYKNYDLNFEKYCNAQKLNAGFHKMKKESIKDFFKIRIDDSSDRNPKQIFIGKNLAMKNADIWIYNLEGTKSSLIFLKILIPFALILDIITLPIQLLFIDFNLGMSS